MDIDKADVCMIAHGQTVLSDATQEHEAATHMIDVGLGRIAVNLDKHHSRAEVLEASGELPSSRLLLVFLVRVARSPEPRARACWTNERSPPAAVAES